MQRVCWSVFICLLAEDHRVLQVTVHLELVSHATPGAGSHVQPLEGLNA